MSDTPDVPAAVLEVMGAWWVPHAAPPPPPFTPPEADGAPGRGPAEATAPEYVQEHAPEQAGGSPDTDRAEHAEHAAPAPERVAHGTLRFDGRGSARLELIGMLRPFPTGGADFTPPVILGVTTGGEPVTLWQCRETGSSGQLGEFRATTIEAQVVVVGAHFAAPEQLQFARLGVRYDHLAEWMGVRGLQVEQLDEHDDGPFRFRVETVPPRVYEAGLPDFTLRLWTGFGYNDAGITQVRVEQWPMLTILPREPWHLDRFFDVLHQLQNFLSFAAGEPAYPLDPLHAVPAGGDRGDGERRAGVTLYYAGRRRAGRTPRPRHGHQMLFGLWDVEDAFETVLQAWFAKADVLSPVHDLYFAAMFGGAFYLQTRFLNFAQAVESYHRRTDMRTYVPKALFKRVASRLRKVFDADDLALPEEARRAFRDNLAHFNELSLRTRLVEVMDRCGDLSAFLIPDREAFLVAAVQTRNYLTHYGRKQAHVADDAEGLYRLSRQLRYLLEVSLLAELGLPPSTREAIVRRYQPHVYFRRRYALAAAVTSEASAAPADEPPTADD